MNRAALMEIVLAQFVPAIASSFGERGTEALRRVLETLHRLYKCRAPELLRDGLVVFLEIESDGEQQIDESDVFDSIEALAANLEGRSLSDGPVVLRLLPQGRVHRLSEGSVNPADLSQSAVVYSFSDEGECFFVEGDAKDIPSFDISPSAFAVPTFKKLEEALQDYRLQQVRYSTCPIFQDVWESSARLVLVNKPESTMRTSLAHFLKIAMRANANVHEEQNVDASHPVDITVSWQFVKRVAIIEIKWVGDSRSSGLGFTTYRDARAREGADQLADYLDAKAAQDPTHDRMGYLVVIDARRRGLRTDTKALSLANARYFSDRNLKFDPRFEDIRRDFASPVRMFAEPAENECLTA